MQERKPSRGRGTAASEARWSEGPAEAGQRCDQEEELCTSKGPEAGDTDFPTTCPTLGPPALLQASSESPESVPHQAPAPSLPITHGFLPFHSQTGIVSLYDCVFKRRLDYNQKLHRDDREHAKGLGLHINEEEQERPVGVLMSSVYGKRILQPVEPLNRDHNRVNHVEADFYRKNDIPSLKEPGFGHINPA
uniref:Uncharacterized protein n=1 Tax=Spermophilus dauricus TaxID=99837 RepID=A0A8C9QCQ2_SPEDA